MSLKPCFVFHHQNSDLQAWGWFNGLLPSPKHTQGAKSEAEPFVISVLLFPAAEMMSECQRDATYPPEFDVNGVSAIISVYEVGAADCETPLFCQYVPPTWLLKECLGKYRFMSASTQASVCIWPKNLTSYLDIKQVANDWLHSRYAGYLCKFKFWLFLKSFLAQGGMVQLLEVHSAALFSPSCNYHPFLNEYLWLRVHLKPFVEWHRGVTGSVELMCV